MDLISSMWKISARITTPPANTGTRSSDRPGIFNFATDPAYGAGIVWARFPEGAKPVLLYQTRIATRDIAVDLSRPGNAPPENPATLMKYTAATELLPTDGIVKKTSSEIVKGKQGDLEKARADHAEKASDAEKYRAALARLG